MKKLFAALKNAPKRVGILAAVAAAVIVPASLIAWGPGRVMFTMAHPADYVTFNSIKDNPKQGDESNFVSIRQAGVGQFGDNTTIEPGKEYEVYVFYHNNASSSLNDEAHQKRGVALDTQMRVQMPASVKAGEQARFTGFVSAANAKHLNDKGENLGNTVWDEAYGTATQSVALRYIPNSATIHNLGATNGSALSDNLITTGVPLGFDKLDGVLPGCNHYEGYVIFKFKAVQPNFTVTKQVSKADENNYSKSVAVKPGDKVDYKIQYKNTGDVAQDNVVIKDTLPAGVTYVPGTTYISNSKTNSQWQPAGQDTLTTQGLTIGSYNPSGNAYLKFTAQVTSADKLACGTNKLTNTAEAQTDNGNKSDTADVTVERECEQPVYTCDAMSVNKLSDTKYKFETGYTVKNGTFKSVQYVVKDASGKVVSTVNGAPNAVEYTQTTPGTYKVTATVTFVVDGKEVVATSDNCAKQFTVPAPAKIKVCELDTKKIITIDEKDFDANKHSKNLNDCASTPTPGTIDVCRKSDKQIVTINENEFDSSMYSKDYNDCATVPTPAPTTPIAPSELPVTGGVAISSIVGLGALVASLGYYIASRRTLG